LALIAGCGTMGDDAPVYTASEEIPPVRVPEGLSAPDVDTRFEIPGYSLPELAAQGNEVRPPQVLSSAEAEQARSRIRFGPLGLYLEVDDTAASTWRRLGFALNRGGLEIEEVLDRERRFRVRFTHEPIRVSDRGLFSKVFLFWRAPEYMDYSGSYLLEVQRETSDTTRVAILDGEGNVLPMQRAEFVLSRLRQRLG
jgi:outer membrane protein assembly factor BamC